MTTTTLDTSTCPAWRARPGWHVSEDGQAWAHHDTTRWDHASLPSTARIGRPEVHGRL